MYDVSEYSNLNNDFLLLCELSFRRAEHDSGINFRLAAAAFLLQLDRILLEPRHDRQLREPFHFRLCEVYVLLKTGSHCYNVVCRT